MTIIKGAPEHNSSIGEPALLDWVAEEQRSLYITIEELARAIANGQARIDAQLVSIRDEMSRGRGCPVLRSIPERGRDGATTTPRVRAQCLGAFHLLVDGIEVQDWRSGKARALFQYLATHREHPTSRDILTEILWPNPDVSMPGTSLKVAVHSLRGTLSRLSAGHELLAVESHEAGYLLKAPDFWLDVDEFERNFAMGRALEARGQVPASLDMYARAADLYRGDFLIDCWDNWVVFRREKLKDQYLFALAKLADAALASDDFESCILCCQQLLEGDRCREDSYRTLMLCHSRLGQRGRVRRWYELCVDTLRTELDSAPEEETQLVYRRAMNGKL